MMHFVLIREGKADAELVSVLSRLCEALGVQEVSGTDAGNLGVGRQISRQASAVLELDPDIDLLFVHMDADNVGLASRREHLAKELAGCPRPCVRVVPVRMTESWLLADPQKIRSVVGHPHGTAPLHLPKPSQIESVGNPKQRLRDALARARAPRKHQKHDEVATISDSEYASYRSELLDTLNINGPVSTLSAWQALVEDTRSALHDLRLASA